MSYNVLAWIIDSLRTHPEQVSIPDVSELSPVELAEIRSRLQQYAQVAAELRKLVDVELAGRLDGAALRYGDTVFRASNGKGTAKVQDEELWWERVVTGLQSVPGRPSRLLAALYPAGAVRLTALPKLEAALGLDDGELKRDHIAYEPSSSPLTVMPIHKAPKYLQDLEEGELR